MKELPNGEGPPSSETQLTPVTLHLQLRMAPGRPLGVGVDVHLHHACLDGVADVLQGGAGAAVEDEGHRLVAVAAQLLLEMKIDKKIRR